MRFVQLLGRSAICVAVASVSSPAIAQTTVAPDPNSVYIPRGVPHSVARMWNEELLDAIRGDLARPTVHARNLFHMSVAMWDAWCAYGNEGDQYLIDERTTAVDVKAAREEAISYACYRILTHRFQNSPGSVDTLASIDALMGTLGYDTNIVTTVGDTPAALGNRIAAAVIAWGQADNANEQNDYANQFYLPVNDPLVPALPGNPDITDPDRWQPLALDFFVGQSGVELGEYPDFLSPEWGQVDAFSLGPPTAINNRDGFDYWLRHDPGPPPLVGSEYYRYGFEMVVIWSGHLDSGDNVYWDISPGGIGNSPLAQPDKYQAYYDFFGGGDWGLGWAINPITGVPYTPQIVPRGDYARILAEFWADGPDSETPPGHWFTILNYVVDHPLSTRQMGGSGPVLDPLEWDVKVYLIMAGTMHDVAIDVWSAKGWYDYLRPVSAIRYMADLGQSSDPLGPSYNPGGIRLYPGYIEVVTADTTIPGRRHAHLAGEEGKIAVYAWRGPDYIIDPETDEAGVGWILAENWWPYQRPSFVTPPFAGYVSGHSTYSRAAALVMEYITGTEYFPGGLGEFQCPQDAFLVFEDGPSVDVTLQWATYKDASDQCSLSRIWGGIHPPADDIPGRHMGEAIAPEAFDLALAYFDGRVSCPSDFAPPNGLDIFDVLAYLALFDAQDPRADLANPMGIFDAFDVLQFLGDFNNGCP